jgi:plasmid maintenance system antidote protein VapI
MAKTKSPPPPASTDDLLRALIERSGLTDYAIAKKADVTATQIGRFKRRERGLTTETADKLFRGLGYVWPPPADQLQPAPTESE